MYGQVGTVYSSYQSVSNCGTGTCIAVSSVGFISFANNAVPIEQVATGDHVTCVLFANGRTTCFGRGNMGQTGINGIDNVSGPAGPLLATQPYISFSDNTLSIASVQPGLEFTCVFRADGRIICFGSNDFGQIGQSLSTTENRGDGPDEMTTLSPIVFNVSNIPFKSTVASTRLAMLTDSTGQLANVFSPLRTVYLLAVPFATATFTIISATTLPSDATVNVNGLAATTPIPLETSRVNEV